MNNETKPYRTVFVGELEQLTGLSTGGRDGELHADSVVARDGLERPILRGTGLAGALLATLDEFDLRIPTEISARLPETAAAVQKCESLWLMHHAHLVDETVQALVRPNVAIHPWTGAAVDGALLQHRSASARHQVESDHRDGRLARPEFRHRG